MGSTVLAVTACTNGSATKTQSKLTQALNSTSASGGQTVTGSLSVLGLSRVLRDKSYPGSKLDLIGDGSGALGRFCRGTGNSVGSNTGSTDPSDGPSDCQCVYSFDQPRISATTGLTIPRRNATGFIDRNGRLCADQRAECSVETDPKIIEIASDHHEDNLIRCDYNQADQVPITVREIRVSIRHIPTGTQSNTFNFTFVDPGTTADYTNEMNYRQVLRHQCRDAIVIGNFMSGSMDSSGVIDTFLSNDPSLSYPLNFYTGNMGATINLFSGNPAAYAKNGAGWLCDFKSPDSSNSGTSGGQTFSSGVDLGSNIDFRLFSSAPMGCDRDASPGSCGQAGNSSTQIYPPKPTFFNRASFKVSSRALGVFNLPLNAYVAPSTMTHSESKGASGPLGYGVQPIRTQTGERCPTPSEVVTPVNHRWVKLWLFRASVPTRQIYMSQRIPAYLPGGIVCNPGNWPTPVPSQKIQVFDDCGGAQVQYPSNEGFFNNRIANRVLLMGGQTNAGAVCLKAVEPTRLELPAECGSLGLGCTSDSNGGPRTTRNRAGIPGLWHRAYAEGTDLYAMNTPSTAGGRGIDGTFDPFDLSYSIQQSRPHGSAYGSVIQDNKPETFRTLNLDPNGNRSDYVFVVSPESVTGEDMRAGNAAALPYIPYRFKSVGTCPYQNPDSNVLAHAECGEQFRIRYSPKKYDPTVVNENNSLRGDPVYPMCVLQEVQP